MKKVIIAVVALFFVATFSSNAQDTMEKAAKTISLEQTPGEFTQKSLTVPAGTYVFEVANKDVGHDVGFVLVKKGEDISKAENHIKTAYVTKVVATGAVGTSQPTVLEKGEYVYFCPMNPTATDNTLTVE